MRHLFIWVLLVGCSAETNTIHVGSKVFTESVILGELATQMLQKGGARAEHRREMGGTQILWKALLNDEIDLYPEYTGTIREEILAGQSVKSEEETRAALLAKGVLMSKPLGFNNTYALGIPQEIATKLGIKKISDLKDHPTLTFGMSNEFMARGDGWPGLKARYQLPQSPNGIAHDLAYRAIESGDIQVTDLYSTDAEIEYYKLKILTDDLRYFPEYQAVFLYRADADVASAIQSLEGAISEDQMIKLNARAKLERAPEAEVAATFLGEARPAQESLSSRLLARTREHLFLVLVSLLASILVALPLGILSAKRPALGQFVLGVVGVIQTIPALALLVFLIPLFGIGAWPAIVALFLYSLLPIVRNTHTGLLGIPRGLVESAQVLGLSVWVRLWRIELPLALPQIIAGVKTSAVLCIGYATLGALIGAGGYGQPILSGIRLDDTNLLLEGAIPSAALALLTQGFFELAERRLLPRGLRVRL